MAEELTEDPNIKKGRPELYPWTDWTNGSWWTATKGEDFEVEVKSFQTGLHVKARGLDMKASTKIEGDKVTFQFAPIKKVATPRKRT